MKIQPNNIWRNHKTKRKRFTKAYCLCLTFTRLLWCLFFYCLHIFVFSAFSFYFFAWLFSLFFFFFLKSNQTLNKVREQYKSYVCVNEKKKTKFQIKKKKFFFFTSLSSYFWLVSTIFRSFLFDFPWRMEKKVFLSFYRTR